MNKEIEILGGIIITPLIKAKNAFDQALVEAKSELERDGAIQRFEFTFELTWKILKKVLAFNGIEANNPRDVFREAAKQGLILDPVIWFEFIRKRNLTVHTYDQSVAVEIFNGLPEFKSELDNLIEKLLKL
jgi:nucleotidyltransferase substrate binding protein (TIGR01987 family)